MVCKCDIRTIMTSGCKCGAFQWEQDQELIELPTLPKIGEMIRIHHHSSLGAHYGGVDDTTWAFINKNEYKVLDVDEDTFKIRISDAYISDDLWIPADVVEIL